jgi:hypothetical protein
VSERDLLLMRRIDELHLEAPYYGAPFELDAQRHERDAP